MANFGAKSLAVYETLEPDLQRLADFLITYTDFSLVQGYRDEIEQNDLFAAGKTTVLYPDSMHNTLPSRAVDIVPFLKSLGQIWPDPDRDTPKVYREKIKMFAHLMGMVRMAALILDIPIRLGYDWDGDFSTLDQSFHDLPHIELAHLPRAV